MDFAIITENGSRTFTVHDNPNEIHQKILDLKVLSIFASNQEKNDEEKLITLRFPLFSKMTEEIKAKANSLKLEYQELVPSIHKINKFVDDIPVNNFFVVRPVEDITFLMNIYFSDSIKRLNDRTIRLSELLLEENPLDKYKEYFGELINYYDIFHPAEKIGEPDKSKRVCIYCNNLNGDTTFKSVAHLIPQSLGNKKYIQYEECDNCNNKFGKTIDNALTEFMNPYRLLFNIGRKEGLEIRYRNYGYVERVNDKNIEIKFYDAKKMDSDSPPPSSISFTPLTNYKPQDVYRALSRIAISCLDKKERTNFTNAISWINSEISMIKVPTVFQIITDMAFDENPQILLYKKKTDIVDCSYPSLIAELHLQNIIFVYIVQNDSEIGKFHDIDDLSKFWQLMKHYGEYGQIEKWNQISFSSDDFTKTRFNLEFKQVEPS